MNSHRLRGLGEPQAIGKHSLFQPPVQEDETILPLRHRDKVKSEPQNQESQTITHRRVRTTIELTSEALQIIQQVQQEYRLRTGKVLPLWQAVSQAIEAYGKYLKR